MRLPGETIAKGIVRVASARPMTVRQIADELDADDVTIRVTMQPLEEKGLMRRAGFGARTRGTTPYLWEAA